MQSSYTVPPVVDRFQRNGLVLGGLGVLLSLVGLLAANEDNQFFHSYLIGYIFAFSIPMGCLGLLMLQHLTGGAWGMVIRRILEAGTRTIPFFAIAFLPIAIWRGHIFDHWLHAMHEPNMSSEMQMKFWYLDNSFFVIRAICYFLIWMGLSYFLNKWSAQQDKQATARITRKFQLVSSAGFLLLVLTMTFASVDWIMALNPHWYSTIFGLLTLAGQAIATMSFVILILALLIRTAPMNEIILPVHLHDLGKLLFAFVMLWAYFSFSQFLIIYSGNLPEETVYFIDRMNGGWVNVAYVIILGHFFIPFFILLSRNVKRNSRQLMAVAAGLLVMRFIDLYWLMEPAWHPGNFQFKWLDIATALGFFGIWLGLWAWQFKKMPLMPVNDPFLAESLHPVGGH